MTRVAPTAPRAPAIPVERSVLPCGAVLLVSRRRDAPVAAAQVHLRGGHSLDPTGREGTAFLAGALADQGTRTRDEEEIASLLEPPGGSVHGDSSGLAGTIEAAEWKLLLELLCDMTLAPTYPRARFEKERARLASRLLVEKDDPRVQAARLFRRLVYGRHWLGRAEHGTLESVARIRRADLAAFHRRHWTARRAVVSVCGDVDPAEVRRFLARRLARWRPGAPPGPPDERFPARAPRLGVFRARRQQAHVYLGHLGVRRSDPDFPALVVMDHVLGTGPGFTSRITRKLRDEQGLAYTVHASITSSAGTLPGTFNAYIGTSPENVGTAIRGFLAEMRTIRSELVSREELELAKSYLLGAFVLGFERASRRVQHMVHAERNGLPQDHLDELLRAFERVDAEDVRRVAREHLAPEAACIAAAGPLTREDLRRAAEAAGAAGAALRAGARRRKKP